MPPPLDLLSRLRRLSGTELVSFDRAGPLEPPAVTAVAGSSLARGVADTLLPDGRWRVVAGEQAYTMQLPATTRRGDRVSLPAASAGAAASPAAHAQAQAKMKAQLQAPAETSVQSRVSATGRLVSQLAHAAGGHDSSRAVVTADPLRPLVPLAGTAELNASTLASGLRAAVSNSGLFYESHLAEWVTGERPAVMLAREPQSRFPRPDAPAAEGPAPERAVIVSDAGVHEESGLPMKAALAGDSGPDAVLLPPAARELVGQQLNLLETRHLTWQGWAWPGQAIEWQVEQAPAREAEGNPADGWRTSLRLSLPQLGNVAAFFSWQQGRLAVRIAADEAQQPLLAAALPALRERLHLAGLAIGPLAVNAHDV